jgi:hypothetical protein
MHLFGGASCGTVLPVDSVELMTGTSHRAQEAIRLARRLGSEDAQDCMKNRIRLFSSVNKGAAEFAGVSSRLPLAGSYGTIVHRR